MVGFFVDLAFRGVFGEVVYGLSLSCWAVRSWPVATGMARSYLELISNSMQYPKRGRLVLAVFAVISMLKISALYKGRGVTQEQQH